MRTYLREHHTAKRGPYTKDGKYDEVEEKEGEGHNVEDKTTRMIGEALCE